MTPRMLTKAKAATYCGCTVRAFTGWVERGIVPAALPGTRRWDKDAIDMALNHKSGLVGTITPSDQLTPYQRWKADETLKAQNPLYKTQGYQARREVRLPPRDHEAAGPDEPSLELRRSRARDALREPWDFQ